MDYALNYLRKYISHFDSCWTLYTWKSLVCLFDYFHLNFNEFLKKASQCNSSKEPMKQELLEKSFTPPYEFRVNSLLIHFL